MHEATDFQVQSSTERDRISTLDVSETWKRRFRLIEKAGGPKLPDFKALPFGERMSLNFNFIAFFLGPIYFVAKGLWRQAVVYFAIAIALVFLFEAIGLGRYTRAVGYGFAALYALRANVSYYQKAVHDEVTWL